MTTRTVLITGGGAGIGAELTRRFRSLGNRVLVVSRGPPAASADPGAEDHCRADLADPIATEVVAEFLRRRRIDGLDLLIHNAATGWIGPVPEQTGESIHECLSVNVCAPIELTHALMPMLRRREGSVAFISSIVSQSPSPDYAVYAASKAALDGFARSLRAETLGMLRVQLIHLGAVGTQLHAKMGLERLGVSTEGFPSANTIAARIADALERGRNQTTIGALNRAVRWAGRNWPRSMEKIRRPRLSWSPPLAPRGERKGRVVVTGAADGIGRALALRFAADGCEVLGIDCDAARSRTTLQEIERAGGNGGFLQADLADSSCVTRLAEELTHGAPISVLVHNAGINYFGDFETTTAAARRAILAVNLEAPMALTAELARRGLLEAGGVLVFISSLSHFVGYPGAAVYAASKDGLAAFAASLAAAGRTFGFHVLTVFPGPTRTEQARRNSPNNRREHRRMAPEDLANRIFLAAQRRRRRLIPGLANQLFAAAGHWFPGIAESALRRGLKRRSPPHS